MVLWCQTRADGDAEKLEASYTAGGDAHGAAALENALAVPRNIKYNVTMGPSDSAPTYIPRRTENIHPHRNLNVYGNVISNS